MKIKTFSHNVMVDNKIVTLKFDITFSAKTKEFEAIVPEVTRVVSSIKEVYKNYSLKELTATLIKICEQYEVFFKPKQIVIEEKLYIGYITEKNNEYLKIKDARINVSYIYFKTTKEYNVNDETQCKYYVNASNYPKLFEEKFLNKNTNNYEISLKGSTFKELDWTQERENFLKTFSNSLNELNQTLNQKMIDLIDNDRVSTLPNPKHNHLLALI